MLPTATHQSHTGTQYTTELTGHRSLGAPSVPPNGGGKGEALTVAEAMMKRPRGGSRDDGILGDPCFGRGVSTKGEYTERKRRDDPQGV